MTESDLRRGLLLGADGSLLFAILSTSVAHVHGARASTVLPAQHVIC